MINYENIKFPEHISWTKLNNRVFVFNEITNDVYMLKGIQKDVWLFIEQKYDFNKILHELSEKYDIELHKVQDKLIKIIESYLSKNILEGTIDEKSNNI